MVGRFIKGASVALFLLGGCRESLSTDPNGDGGRYRGIGIATPGKQWTKIAAAPKPGDAKTATLADDDYVVFVTDSQTGEVRECGDRTGFCVRFQPWKHPAPLAPVALTDHASSDETVSVADAATDDNQVKKAKTPAR